MRSFKGVSNFNYSIARECALFSKRWAVETSGVRCESDPINLFVYFNLNYET